MPVIDVWSAVKDLDVPEDVLMRLLERWDAHRKGDVPDPVPEADKPFLARHIVTDAPPAP
ncbi:hypothetical protein ACLQ2R_17620 [Streptosporangium sp. DT93]|uniref:hypothetical protein n=1 Tax=Streptosporangium sp. DT93 TaxID=3393428 RepID=UPI003CF9DEF5